MKLIERKDYLNKLLNVRGTPDIKVITGIRRSGKSKLMESFIEKIKEESNVNIIHINFNKTEYECLNEYHKLLDYISDKYEKGKSNYIFIDEVQMCNGFEKAINSLHSSEMYDIYITGSNAFLLSSDLATLFTGRTFEIELFPFSFKEFLEYYGYSNMQEAYIKYVNEGGMSGSYLYNETEDKYKYINDIFDMLILRDIKQKYNIRNEMLLSKITDYLTDNISNLTSPYKISEVIRNTEKTIDHKTVDKYINYLLNAFAFYKVRRYDIKGKKYLSSTEKFYLSDHSFKYARWGSKNTDYGKIMENIVAIELMRRGYEIYVGVLYQKEIDFVALKGNEKIYIQVSDSIEDEKTKERELDPLIKIKDAYPKMIITRTGYPDYDIEGVKIVDITNWLKQ